MLTLFGKCTLANIQSSWRNPIAPTKLLKKKYGVWLWQHTCMNTLHVEPALLSQSFEGVHQPLPHLPDAPAIPRASSGIPFAQVEPVQLPRAKYAFDASKILDKLQLPNWLASGEHPAICQATKGIPSLYIQKYLGLSIFLASRQLF